jgi:hypothetical protein
MMKVVLVYILIGVFLELVQLPSLLRAIDSIEVTGLDDKPRTRAFFALGMAASALGFVLCWPIVLVLHVLPKKGDDEDDG